MNQFLLKMLVPIVMQVIEGLLSPDNLRTYGDRLFDFIEDAVKDSKTDIDDITVLPVIQMVRKAFNIPNNT
jgi:hypothetical protein